MLRLIPVHIPPSGIGQQGWPGDYYLVEGIGIVRVPGLRSGAIYAVSPEVKDLRFHDKAVILTRRGRLPGSVRIIAGVVVFGHVIVIVSYFGGQFKSPFFL